MGCEEAFAEAPEPFTEQELFVRRKQHQSSFRDTACKAICKIKHLLRQEGAQQDGRAVTLPNWDTQFKTVLGSYIKFLLSRPDQFRVVEGDGLGQYTIEDVTLNKTVVAPSWTKGKGKGKGKGKLKGKVMLKCNEKGKGKAKGKVKSWGAAYGKGKIKGAISRNFEAEAAQDHAEDGMVEWEIEEAAAEERGDVEEAPLDEGVGDEGQEEGDDLREASEGVEDENGEGGEDADGEAEEAAELAPEEEEAEAEAAWERELLGGDVAEAGGAKSSAENAGAAAGATESPFPVERAAAHGSYIRSLLGGALFGMRAAAFVDHSDDEGASVTPAEAAKRVAKKTLESTEGDAGEEARAPAPPPSKKAKKAIAHARNINHAVDKAYESCSFKELSAAPVTALQGLAARGEEVLGKFHIKTVGQLGRWKFYRVAKAITGLSDLELKGARHEEAAMNIDAALVKKHEAKCLRDIVKLPPSALQGLADWADKELAKLHIKTIADLGAWKFAKWSELIADSAEWET